MLVRLTYLLAVFGRRRLVLLGAALLLTVGAAVCRADDRPGDMGSLSIEELMQVEVNTVYGASRYEQDLSEAPSSVSIVTAQEIKMYGYRFLADILQSVRGFSVTYDRNYYYFGTRGFGRPGDYGTRMLILIDGIRVNDAVYSQGPVGFEFPLDVDLIDHVEIIRGPSQSIYGSNAFFGVINVVTRRAKEIGGVEASASAGSFSTYGGRLSYGRKFQGGAEAVVSGSYTDSEGQDLHFPEFDSPATNNGWARGCDGLRFGSGFFKFTYGDFSLEGAAVQARKQIPTASWGTVFNSPDTKTTDTYQLLSLKYEHSFPSRLDIMARLTGNWYRYKGDYLYDVAQAPPPQYDLGRDRAYGDWVGGELLAVKELDHRHKILVGGDFRQNYRQEQSYLDYTGLWDDKHDSFSWGVYLQDEYRLLENLIINAGIRYDYFSTFGSTWNPRVALIYSPLEDTTLKLLYGKAFRAPNAYELYSAPDPDHPRTLREETITSYEAVLEQRMGDHLNGTVSAFLNRMSNIISQDSSQPTSINIPFTNAGKFETRGVEFEVQGRWAGGFRGRASYSLQSAIDLRTGDVLPNTPRQLAKLNAIIPLVRENVFLGVEEQYTGAKKTLLGTELSGYWLTNVTLSSQNLLPGLELSASVYNLFDQGYSVPGAGEHLVNGMQAIDQDGRTFRVKLTYRF